MKIDTTCSNVCQINVQLMSHETQHREHGKSSKYTCATIKDAKANAVSVEKCMYHKWGIAILLSCGVEFLILIADAHFRDHSPVAVVVVFIVASKSSKDTLANSIREKYLCPCINPYLKREKGKKG